MSALALRALLIGIVVNVDEPSAHFFTLVLAGYGAMMWKLRGTTIGGIICNVCVVRIDGRDIDWETKIVRALGCFLSAIPLGLGFFWIIFDSASPEVARQDRGRGGRACAKESTAPLIAR